MQESILSLERCKRSIILLSLDLTGFFYEKIGLNLPSGKKTAFVEELRRVIMDMGGGSVLIPIPLTLVQTVLQKLEARLGSEMTNLYLDWVSYIYEESPSDHPHTYAWSTILSWCASRPSRWALLSLPTKKSSDLRRHMESATSWDDIEKLVAERKSNDLTPWDSKLIDERKFEDGPWDPDLAVESIIFRYRFRCALETMFTHFSEEEITVIWKKVQLIGLENELTEINDLRGPKDLHEPA